MIHKTVKIIAQSLLLSMPLLTISMDGNSNSNSNSNLSETSSPATPAASQLANNGGAAQAVTPAYPICFGPDFKFQDGFPREVAEDLTKRLNALQWPEQTSELGQLPDYSQVDAFKSIDQTAVTLKAIEYLMLLAEKRVDDANNILYSMLPLEFAFFKQMYQDAQALTLKK